MDSVASALNSLTATRYLAAAGLVALLWDHLLTLNREICFIWTVKFGKRYSTKAAFIFNRYGTEAIMIYIAYVTSGMGQDLDDTSCRNFVIFVGATGGIFVIVSHFIILLRVYSLWDQRKGVAYVLICGFAVAMTAILICEALAIRDLLSHLHFIKSLNACIIDKKSMFVVGIWAVLSTFDFFIILVTVFNAMDRPHRTNIEVMDNLFRDGARIFLALFALRFLELVVSAVGKASDIMVVMFIVWALCSILNSRLHLRVEALKFVRPFPLDDVYELEIRQ